MGHIQTLGDFISLLSRRRWVIAVVIVLGALASVLFALSQPKVYEAIAVIQIETPAVEAADLTGTAPGGAAVARQVQLIEQRLMARDNLLEVIAHFGLFADLPGLTDQQKIDALRRATRIETIAAAAQGFGDNGLSAVVITTRLGAPQLAADVANHFAESILTSNARDRSERLAREIAFFRDEAARLDAEIATLEAEVSAFRDANAAALPGNAANRRDEATALRTEVRALEQRLLALASERRLAAAAPDLRAVELRALEQLDEEIAVLTLQRDELARRVDEVEAVLERAPEVAQALAGYEREMQTLQERRAVVVRRQAEAETSLRLEAARQTERLELLERAVPPDFAGGTSRRKLALAGGVASVGLALALAFALDLLHPVLRTAREMERTTGLVPVITIPQLAGMAPAAPRRWPLRLALAVLLAGAIVIAAGALAMPAG